MRRFARNPRQFVQRLRRGWRTRRGWMLITDIASAVAGVLLMFTVMILNAWGFRRAAVVAGVFMAAALAARVVAHVAARRYGHRRARGLCVQCGYDLRGSPGRTCPECGAWNPKLVSGRS